MSFSLSVSLSLCLSLSFLSYNVDNLIILQPYVDSQLSSQTYDRDANLAILKLYQFNPGFAQPEYIVKILVKALTALPNPDFSLCLCLLIQETLSHPSVKKLSTLQHELETCQWSSVWKAVSKGGSTFKEIETCFGFHEQLRKSIARVVALTFESLELKRLEIYLGFQGAKPQLLSWIKTQGWTLNEKDQMVQLPSHPPPPRQAAFEGIQFEQLTKIIGYSNKI